ncbi:MAG: hypothetical protein CMB77_05300 [Euryarchaeota archaeon]|nr:hypothetical protein [Euryarchaeota archaeon]
MIEKSIGENNIGNARLLPYQYTAMVERLLSLADIRIVSLAPAMEGVAIPSRAYSYMASRLPILAPTALHSDAEEYACLPIHRSDRASS